MGWVRGGRIHLERSRPGIGNDGAEDLARTDRTAPGDPTAPRSAMKKRTLMLRPNTTATTTAARDTLPLLPGAQQETQREVEARVAELLATLERGHVYNAVTRFYAADVKLGRGAVAPMFGLALPAARRFLRRHPDIDWRGLEVEGVGINGDTSFIECTLLFEAPDGELLRLPQVVVAQWHAGRIVRECVLPGRREPRA